MRKKNRIACPRTASADRQLGEVDRHPPRLVLGEPLIDRAAVRLVVIVEIAERPARSGLADDEARIVLLLDDHLIQEVVGPPFGRASSDKFHGSPCQKLLG